LPDDDELSEEEVAKRTRALLMDRTDRTPEQDKRKRQARRADQEFLKTVNIQKPIGRVKQKDVKILRELKDEFKHTWERIAAKFDNFKYFSERQIKFAKYYAQNGRTSILNASIRAGYVSKHAPTHINNMKITMKMAGFEELIQAFEFEEKAKLKIEISDVVKWFHDIATAAMASGDFTNANRSMESLAKYLGMFIERREVTHRVVQNKQELDDRIAELTAVLREAEPEIEARLRTH